MSTKIKYYKHRGSIEVNQVEGCKLASWYVTLEKKVYEVSDAAIWVMYFKVRDFYIEIDKNEFKELKEEIKLKRKGYELHKVF